MQLAVTGYEKQVPSVLVTCGSQILPPWRISLDWTPPPPPPPRTIFLASRIEQLLARSCRLSLVYAQNVY